MKQDLDIRKIEPLEGISENILNIEAYIKKERYALISSIIRTIGEEEPNGDISIKLTDNYRGAGVRFGNAWYEVNYLCLRHTDGENVAENYEVYFKWVWKSELLKLIDTDDPFEEFYSDIITGERRNYPAGIKGIHYFLEDLMLKILGTDDNDSEKKEEQNVEQVRK